MPYLSLADSRYSVFNVQSYTASCTLTFVAFGRCFAVVRSLICLLVVALVVLLSVVVLASENILARIVYTLQVAYSICLQRKYYTFHKFTLCLKFELIFSPIMKKLESSI